MSHVAVVTDSTAMLAPGTHDVVVVPTQVVIAGEAYDDGGPESSSEALLAAMTAKRPLPVSTSRPAPALFAEVYRGLAEQGVEEIVSIHLSAEMSGTLESARIAARTSPVPVVTLDTRGVGPCVGYAVAAAAATVADGGTAVEAAAAAIARADATRSYFYVATLEHLRRGGRIGAGARLVGSALAVKPLLAVEDGLVVLHERVRTAARALARIEELTVEAAGDRRVEATVAHLGAETTALGLAEVLGERLGPQLAVPVRVGELGAVLGAHVGPGTIATVVAPAL
jgi:DegV family protein with EDD domain